LGRKRKIDALQKSVEIIDGVRVTKFAADLDYKPSQQWQRKWWSKPLPQTSRKNVHLTRSWDWTARNWISCSFSGTLE
jgi:hypothetical protein